MSIITAEQTAPPHSCTALLTPELESRSKCQVRSAGVQPPALQSDGSVRSSGSSASAANRLTGRLNQLELQGADRS